MMIPSSRLIPRLAASPGPCVPGPSPVAMPRCRSPHVARQGMVQPSAIAVSPGMLGRNDSGMMVNTVAS